MTRSLAETCFHAVFSCLTASLAVLRSSTHSQPATREMRVVDEIIASHTCEVDGWQCMYELTAERLIAVTTKGDARQRHEMELRHSGDVPDWGLSDQMVQHPAYRIVWICTVLLLLLLFGAGN